MQYPELQQIIREHTESFKERKDLIPRDISISESLLRSDEIIVITGVRRCGKSSLMRLLCDRLNLPWSQTFYINFDDERFVDFITEDFNKIVEVCWELAPPKTEKIYLFLDEIQNVANFERWLNRLYESKQYKLFVSGSNANLLSAEIATVLTGRNITVPLYPFSLKEHLRLENVPSFANSNLTTKEKTLYRQLFKEYYLWGGFPVVLKVKDTELLSQYYRDILYKDLIVRHKIKHPAEIREFSKYLFSNIGSFVSYNQCAKLLIGPDSPNTIKNYLAWLKETYLLFTLNKFDPSFKKQVHALPKIYAVDHSLARKIGFAISENNGLQFENIVYLELIRRDKEVYYYQLPSNKEVDFIIREGNKITTLIQVAYQLNSPQTIEREESALLEAMQLFQLSTAYIINDTEEKQVQYDNLTIQYIPLWKWLLC